MVRVQMIARHFQLLFTLLATLLIASAPAAAHPHVWITAWAEIVYAADGSATAVRHTWTFDDMYSAFATQDLPSKEKGKFTREELADLAQVNMDSLKDYEYFTFVTADGKKLVFAGPTDYWLEYKDSVLTLRFTLPLAAPARAAKLNVEIYDPEYFVDFTFAQKDPVRLAGAPEQCKLTVLRPSEASTPGAQRIPDALAQQPGANFGVQFASRIFVECPVVAAALADTAQEKPLAPPRAEGPRAQTTPPASSSGFVGWILAKQAEFYRAMSQSIRSAKQDGTAVWTLLLLSFLYGIFHAAGPGHGKAVISSYVVANEETWWRGVVLSFAAAFVQAVVAVSLVSIAVVIFRASNRTMCDTERIIEIASYALIALVGARLVWVKGRGFASALFALDRPLRAVGAAVTPRHDHQHRDHEHGHDHYHASAWGHAHGPEPENLAGPGGWKRGLSAVVAVGLRPCSGAILVLVFALAQGLYWAGVVSTFVMAVGTAMTVAVIATIAVAAKSFAMRVASARAGYGTLLLRGIEVAAAFVVLLFGLLLMFGYMAVERGACL
jgi:nickel/cobalt exporter